MKRVLVAGTMQQLHDGMERLLAERGYEACFLPDVTSADIDCGLAHVDNDLCASTVAIVGQYLRVLETCDTCADVAVLAPSPCHECRCTCAAETLELELERSGHGSVEVVAFSSAEVAACAPAPCMERLDASKPVIGVCGTVPVLTTAEFRHVVCERLEQAGCEVVLAPLQRVADEQDFLTPALEAFESRGVRTAICILPFGCLGGHVYGRGQLRAMQRRFGSIELTMLDYDPSASDINLVNRTELVIQSAREKAQSAAG